MRNIFLFVLCFFCFSTCNNKKSIQTPITKIDSASIEQQPQLSHQSEIIGDTIYLPCVKRIYPEGKNEDLGNKCPILKFYTYQSFEVRPLTKDSIKLETEHLKILEKKTDWGKTVSTVRFFFKGKKIFEIGGMPRFVEETSGFNGEETDDFSLLKIGNENFIQLLSIQAPTLPSDIAYIYYYLTKEDSIVIFKEQNVFVNKINIEGSQLYSTFTEGCVTVKIPLKIDFKSYRILAAYKDSAIFPVHSFYLSINSYDNEGYSPAEKTTIKLFSKPAMDSKFKELNIEDANSVNFIRQYYPKFQEGDYKTVWSFIKVKNEYGWVFDEDRGKLGVWMCE